MLSNCLWQFCQWHIVVACGAGVAALLMGVGTFCTCPCSTAETMSSCGACGCVKPRVHAASLQHCSWGMSVKSDFGGPPSIWRDGGCSVGYSQTPRWYSLGDTSSARTLGRRTRRRRDRSKRRRKSPSSEGGEGSSRCSQCRSSSTGQRWTRQRQSMALACGSPATCSVSAA